MQPEMARKRNTTSTVEAASTSHARESGASGRDVTRCHADASTSQAKPTPKRAMLKSHKCGVCGKVLSRKTDVKRHRATHTGKKPDVSVLPTLQGQWLSRSSPWLRIYTGDNMEHYTSFLRCFFIELCLLGTMALLLLLHEYNVNNKEISITGTDDSGQAWQRKQHRRNQVAVLDKGLMDSGTTH
ncbi:hypothetical protein MTO96_010258 [Rhipicephalus appendiculatus]